MSTKEHAAADAKSHSAMAAASRLSLCTNAMASSVRTPTRITPVHLIQLTLDSLRMMRCRRASRRVLQGSDDFTLCGLLAFGAGRVNEGELQRVIECGGYHRQRGLPSGHRRPLLADGLLDVATEENPHAFFGLARKRLGEKVDGPQCARLAVDRELCPIGVVPDLRCEKSHEKAEEQAHRG